MTPVGLDEHLDNADWTKQTWDLPFDTEAGLDKYLKATGMTREQWDSLPVAAAAPWLGEGKRAVWDESKHPRDPGGEHGGEFIAKGSTAADEPPVKDSGPYDTPAHTLQTSGYESGPGKTYYRENVAIFIEDGVLFPEKLVEELDSVIWAAPEALRRNVRSVNVLTGKNPQDAHWESKFERPGFESAASASSTYGQINIWNNPTGISEWTMWHEMGHLMHDGGPADNGRWLDAQSMDVSSGNEVLDRIKASEPDLGSTDYFNVGPYPIHEGKVYGQPTVTYHSKSGGSFLLGDEAVTDYGRENLHEDYAEAVELYMKDLRNGGLATVKEDGFLRRIYFEDIWPQRHYILNQEIGL